MSREEMPIQKPGKRKQARRRPIQADLLLTPLIDTLIVLVLFLIMHFRSVGELICVCKGVELPWSNYAHGELERSPIIQISRRMISVEGVKVGSSREVLADRDDRIPELTDKLQEMRKIDEMMFPGQRFEGRVVINAAKDVDFVLIRRVMRAAVDAGYADFNYAVRTGPPPHLSTLTAL
jgi:biopolymer transport protein ExbD